MKFLILLLSLISVSAWAYVEEEVHFAVGDGVVLTGYVARPDAVGTYPALVMQMGHGQGTTDNPNRDYNPFAKMARELAEQGFVVLRFDKRGTGYNCANGSFADGTFSDYVSDLKFAVRSIQGRRDVLREKVFLFGHSLGGPVVSLVAKDYPEIKGIILSASPGRSFAEFNLEQMRYLLEWGQGLTGEALDRELAAVKLSGQLIDQPDAFCREFPLDCETKNGKTYMWGQSAQFWKEIAALDPLASLRGLKGSIFALHGTSDWVVSSENDGSAIEAALAHNSKFSFEHLDGLDHFLLKAESKKASVELFQSGMKDAKLEIHPNFIPTISALLKKWSLATQSNFQKVDDDLRLYDETVATMKAEFAKTPANPKDLEWVKKKLKHMFDVDQYMRQQMQVPFEHAYTDAEKEYFSKEFGSRFRQVDSENTSDLKELLKIYHWFVISQFGAEADNNAWILVQHADEQPDFQKQVLAILVNLYKSKETSPRNYAYLFDRVAASYSDLSKRKLQRYGTQGQCIGPGTWEPIPMEEPAKVDDRRAEVGLGTMAEYIAMFKDICH